MICGGERMGLEISQIHIISDITEYMSFLFICVINEDIE